VHENITKRNMIWQERRSGMRIEVCVYKITAVNSDIKCRNAGIQA
jgi:hypothetical protein